MSKSYINIFNSLKRRELPVNRPNNPLDGIQLAYKLTSATGGIMRLLICICLLLITSVTTFSDEKIILTMGHFASVSHAGNTASKMFAQNVNRRTQGAIKVNVFPNNQLGSPLEVMNRNIAGTIDMSLPSQGQLAQYSNKFGCIMIPFLFESYEEVYKFLDGPFIDWVGSEIEKQGLVFLSNWEWGFRHLTNNKRAIYTPEDVEGLSIRTPPELANQLLMDNLGADVETIAWTELPMALKQHIVDGQENPISVIYNYRIYETQKYLTMTRHTYNSMVHVISKKTWDRLSPEYQNIIKEESIKAGNFMRKTIQREEIEQLKELEMLGMNIVWPDTALFKAAIPEVYTALEKRLGVETYQTFMTMVKEFKKQ